MFSSLFRSSIYFFHLRSFAFSLRQTRNFSKKGTCKIFYFPYNIKKKQPNNPLWFYGKIKNQKISLTYFNTWKQNYCRDHDQIFCLLEILRLLNRSHLAEFLKTKWLQTYLLDNLEIPAWKHLQNIQNSVVLASGKLCVSCGIQLSNSQHCRAVRSRRGTRTKRSTLMVMRLARAFWFSTNLSLRIALGYGSPEVTEPTMGKFTQSGFYSLSCSPCSLGGGYHTWNSHFRTSSSVSTVYSRHFCDCSAEVLLFLSTASSFYASLITGRAKKITSSIVSRCLNYFKWHDSSGKLLE